MATMNAFAAGSSSESSDGEQDAFLYPSTNPNADEFHDHNPRKRRRTGRDAKESAALGIFGSESEDEGPGKRWKSEGRSLRAKGVSFAKAGEIAKDDEEDDEEEDGKFEYPGEEEDVEMGDAGDLEQTAGLRSGLGFSAQGGLGYGGGQDKNSESANSWESPGPKVGFGFAGSSSTPLGIGFVPSSASTPILNESLNDQTTPIISRPSAFSSTPVPTSRHGGRGMKSSQDGGSGGGGGGVMSFAEKMMAKMGYQAGKGLGKDGQGRTSVIDVKLRPMGVGLGAVQEKSKAEKDEEKRQARMRGEVIEDSDDEKQKRKKKNKALGLESGSGRSTPKKAPRKKFQTIGEIQKAAPGLEIPDAFTPILDMTGASQRLLNNASGLMTPTATKEIIQDQENSKLARRAQNDLSAFVEEWKNLQEQKAWVELQVLEYQQERERQQTEHDQMQSVSEIVKSLLKSSGDGQWDPVFGQLLELEKLGGGLGSLPQEEVSQIAVAALHPFLRLATEGWQPLEDPKLANMAGSIKQLQGILGIHSKKDLVSDQYLHRTSSKSTTAYETMMYSIWLPKIRSAIINDWDVHNPNPLLTLVEKWDNLMPGFIRSQVIDQLIVRKLEKAVAAWNPKKRRHNSLPHLWLFPWLQYLGSHHTDHKSSTGLTSDVKRKFRVVIDTWDFKDGVIPGLAQWQEFLGRDLDNMKIRHVLPRMAAYIRTNFQVDPQDQEPYLVSLQNIFKWKESLGKRMLSQVIIDEVFPMWHEVLHQWLTSDGVNYEEVGAWFEWWKTVIPTDLNAMPAIEKEWEKGLLMINHALDLGPNSRADLPPPVKPSRTHISSNHTSRSGTPAPPPAPPPPAKKESAVTPEVGMRDVLEDWCMRNDLLFVGERKAHSVTGLPLFRITARGDGKGGVLVYLRGDLVIAQKDRKGDIWVPVDLDGEELVELAHR